MTTDPPPGNNWARHSTTGATPDTLHAITTADATTLTGADLVDAITATEKALSLLTGLQHRFMAALAEPFTAGDPMRLATRLARKNSLTTNDSPDRIELCVPEAAVCLAAAEIAAALRISPVTAGIRVREATTMTTTLAPTLHALEQGLIDRGKSRVIADHSQPLTPEHTTDLQNIVLPEAPRLTTSELRDLTAQAVIAIDPDGAEQRHHAAAARRELTLRAQPDAMATLNAFLPADGAVKIFQISDLLATSTAGLPDDDRGIGARRIDALIDIADHLLTHGHLDLTHYLDHPLTNHTTTDTDTNDGTNDRGDNDDGNDRGDNDDGNDRGDNDRGDSDRGDTDTDDGNDGTNDGGDNNDHGDGTRTEKPHPDSDPTPPGDHPDTDPTDRTTTDPTPGPADRTTTGPEGDEQPGNDTSPPDGPDPTGTANTTTSSTSTGTRSGTGTSSGAGPRPTDRATPLPNAAGKPVTSTDRSRRALTRQGRRPHLSVTIGLDTLTGRNNLPAYLSGFGAIPACLGRAIAHSAGTVTALFADPTTGIITSAGDLTYRPTQQLRDQIAALKPTCEFPSCRQPVWRCDLDHREPFNHNDPHHGGHTNTANTGPHCRRHHLLKHHTDWRFRVDPENFTIHWTSPTGHHYTRTTRPQLLPQLAVTTPTTALAEQLDQITTPTPPEKTPSSVEELLTTLLLHRPRPAMEYQPAHNFWLHHPHEQPHTNTIGTGTGTGTDRHTNDADLPEEPPF